MTSTPEQSVEQILADMQQLQRQMADSYRVLARAGGALASREHRLDQQHELRDELCLALGQEVFKLVAAGSSIEVAHPIDPDDPTGQRAAVRELLEQARRRIGPVFSLSSSSSRVEPLLRPILDRLGAPTQPVTLDDYDQLLRRLDASVDHIDDWGELPRSVQQMLMGVHSSLGQVVQAGPPVIGDRLRPTFGTLVSWSREHRPGFVSGLSRHNDPEDGTWHATAMKWWERLQGAIGEAQPPPGEVLGEVVRALRQGVGSAEQPGLVDRVRRLTDDRALDRALSVRLLATMTPHRSLLDGVEGLELFAEVLEEQAREDDDMAAVADADLDIDPSGDDLAWVRGATMVVVGGDAPPGAPDRIETAFDLEVRWLGAGLAEIDELVADVQRGEVTVLLLVRDRVSYREVHSLVPLVGSTEVEVRVVDDVSLRSVRAALSAG